MKIPEYTSRVTPAAPSGNQISSDLFTAGGKNMAEQGKKLEAIAQKFYNLKVQRESTKASNDLNMELTNLEVQATNDKDPDNFNYYVTQRDKIVSKYSNVISDRAAKARFSQQAQLAGFNTISKIQATKRKQSIEAQFYESDRKLEVSEASFVATTDLVEKKILQEGVLRTIDENVKNGIYSPVQGMARRTRVKEAWEKKWQTNQVQAILNKDPDLAEQMIVNGDFGEFTPDEKANWLRIIEQKRKQIKAERKAKVDAIRKNTLDQLDQKLFKETLEISDIETASKIPVEDGGVQKKELVTRRNTLLSSQKKSLEYIMENNPEAEEYIKITDKILTKSTDLAMARELIIEAYGDGVISKEESESMTKVVKHLKDMQWNQTTGNIFINGWKTLKAWAGKTNKSTDETVGMLRQFLLESTKDNANPIKISTDLIDIKKKEAYPQYNNWEIGKSYGSAIGSIKVTGIDDDGMPIVEIINKPKSEKSKDVGSDK
ncbi:MAG: hypothetical protein U9O94_10670 [Nanoarchaeota archaeon]|nr:hypothetical protein [Nanoarchaeota archaeon]